VDIGASGGVDPRWKALGVPFKSVLFEPDPREYHQLKSKSESNSIVLNSALSSEKCEVELNLCKKQMASSIFNPNLNFLKLFPDSLRFEVINKIKINADTLNNQLKNQKINNVDFIKIDTQGYELSILKGGSDYIDSSIGLEIEVEFEKIYESQPLFDDIDKFVKSKGFSLFDIKRCYWKRNGYDKISAQKGQIVWGDALYFKTPETLLNSESLTEDKIIRAIYVYLSYGYIDLSKVLLSKANEAGLLSEEVFNKLNVYTIRFYQKKFYFYFLKSNKISAFFKKIALYFERPDSASGSDAYLGN
jgi:FkbM family methyltransferase